MVDQNASSQHTTAAKEPESSQAAQKGGGTDPTVAKAGEYMLIFALVLIFCVCVAVCIHLHIRRQKRNRKREARRRAAKKSKAGVSQQKDSDTQEQKVAELVGTPLCEMGESEPRHEMEDVEVHERYTTINIENPRDHPVLTRDAPDPDLEAGTMFGEMTTHSVAGPGAAAYAVYMSR